MLMQRHEARQEERVTAMCDHTEPAEGVPQVAVSDTTTMSGGIVSIQPIPATLPFTALTTGARVPGRP